MWGPKDMQRPTQYPSQRVAVKRKRERRNVGSLSSGPGTQHMHRESQLGLLRVVLILDPLFLKSEDAAWQKNRYVFPSTRQFTSWNSFRFGDIQDPGTSNCSEMTPLGRSLEECLFPLFFPQGKPCLKITR